MGPVLNVLEVALIAVTFLWVGNRPTVLKVSAIIVVVWGVEFGSFALGASGQGLSLYDYGLQVIHSSLDSMRGALNSGDRSTAEAVAAVVAGCTPALFAVSASARVFAALCARWVLDRIRRKTRWSAFSDLDLAIWWVVPLMAGIAVYIASLVPGMPGSWQLFLLAANVLVASVIPLFVQGAAAGKGILNRMRMRLAWQLVLGLFALATGVAFAVLPLLGLVDFWANFRKLPRDGRTPPERRLPGA